MGFVFEKPDFKLAEITHKYFINEIKIPDELKKTNNFEKIREEAQRVGKIVRESVIDGEKNQIEKEFAI